MELFNAGKCLCPIIVASMIFVDGCKKAPPSEPTLSLLDSTSHAWTFTETRLGIVNSDLHDVAIINDTLICAVGEIYLNDSTGELDPKIYNLVIWDGKSWKLQRVPYHYQGQLLYNAIQTVFAFGANDIYFAGNGVVHWDGSIYSNVDAVNPLWGPYLMEKIWGTSGIDLYIVGDGGKVVHGGGDFWQSVQTGTSLNFYDVYGSSGLVLAVASDPFSGLDRRIVRLAGNSATTISDNPITLPLFSVWFDIFQKYFVCGAGMYETDILGTPWINVSADSSFSLTERIRGNSIADLFAVGSTILHFNGSTWRSYADQTLLSREGYASVAVKGNLAVAVGSDAPNAVATIGKRY